MAYALVRVERQAHKMKNIILSILLSTLSLSASATTLRVQGPTVTAEFGRTALPPCGRSSMVIFHGEAFDGNVLLHDTDLVVSPAIVSTVRRLASEGQKPGLCQVAGIAFVTVVE